MPIEFLVLKGQIRMRLPYHHFLLCRHEIKKLCIPSNVLFYLQVHTRYCCLMIECLGMLVGVLFWLYFENFLEHFHIVDVFESFNLPAFFFQPLLFSTFTLLLDFLVYSVVFFLVCFRLSSLVSEVFNFIICPMRLFNFLGLFWYTFVCS